LPKAGKYEVRLSYSPSSNRATNVPVIIHHAGGESTVTVNQRKAPALVMVGHWGLSFDITPKGGTPFTALVVDRAAG